MGGSDGIFFESGWGCEIFAPAGLGQEEEEHQKRRERDGAQAEKRYVESGEMDEIAAVAIAERSARADCCGERTCGQIEATGAACAIGDNEYPDHSEYGVRDAIETLDGNERTRRMRERVENGTQRQHTEADKQQRSASVTMGLEANPGSGKGDDELRDHDTGGHKSDGCLCVIFAEELAQLRQHGGIREVEEEAADEEEQEYAIVREQPQRIGEAPVFRDTLAAAPGELIVDLARLDQQCGCDGGNHQQHCGNKNSAIAKVVAYRKYQQGSGDIACGVERLIATELPVEAALAYQSHGDGGKRGRKKRGRAADQYLSAKHRALAGLPGEQHCTEPQHERAGNDNQPLAACLVHDAARWSLQCDRHQAPDGERIESRGRGPVGSNKVGSEKRTEASLHVRQEEVAGLQRPEAGVAGVRSANRKSGHS